MYFKKLKRLFCKLLGKKQEPDSTHKNNAENEGFGLGHLSQKKPEAEDESEGNE